MNEKRYLNNKLFCYFSLSFFYEKKNSQHYRYYIRVDFIGSIFIIVVSFLAGGGGGGGGGMFII